MAKKHYYKGEIAHYCLYKHLTVDEIFEYMQKFHPQIGRSTIYRNVEELVQEGKLKRIAGAGQKTIYEGKVETHAHLICRKSGKIQDLPFSAEYLQNIPAKFKISELDINIYGEFAE